MEFMCGETLGRKQRQCRCMGRGGGGGGGGGGGFSLGLGEGNCDLWVLIRGGGAPWTREWFSAMHADSCSI